jgi:hypothetical protein
MKDPKLEVKFTAKRATGPRAEVSRIDFLINGKWDPGVGDKFIDFGGKVSCESDGDIAIEFTPSRIAGPRVDIRRELQQREDDQNLGAEVRQAVARGVLRGGQGHHHRHGDAAVQELDAELQKEDIRWRRLREDRSPSMSTAMRARRGRAHNQDLSRKRKEKVKKLLIDELSSGAKILDSARGEANPGEKNELEDFSQRRVEVWFEIPLG